MQLTRYTDYTVRVLIFLCMQPQRVVTIREISLYYAISRNHLVKVVQNLAQQGLVQTTRGKRGGLRLAPGAEAVTVGEIVRRSEPTLALSRCLTEAEGEECAVVSICRLRSALEEASTAFFAVLDRYTIADLIQHGPELHQVLTQATATGRFL